MGFRLDDGTGQQILRYVWAKRGAGLKRRHSNLYQVPTRVSGEYDRLHTFQPRPLVANNNIFSRVALRQEWLVLHTGAIRVRFAFLFRCCLGLQPSLASHLSLLLVCCRRGCTIWSLAKQNKHRGWSDFRRIRGLRTACLGTMQTGRGYIYYWRLRVRVSEGQVERRICIGRILLLGPTLLYA